MLLVPWYSIDEIYLIRKKNVVISSRYLRCYISVDEFLGFNIIHQQEGYLSEYFLGYYAMVELFFNICFFAVKVQVLVIAVLLKFIMKRRFSVIQVSCFKLVKLAGGAILIVGAGKSKASCVTSCRMEVVYLYNKSYYVTVGGSCFIANWD